jgi:hypothetical protein
VLLLCVFNLHATLQTQCSDEHTRSNDQHNTTETDAFTIVLAEENWCRIVPAVFSLAAAKEDRFDRICGVCGAA